MRVALDTNRYTDAWSGDPTVTRNIEDADEVFLPFVALAELRQGFLKGTRAAENERRLREFLAFRNVRMLFADEATTVHYAALYHQLRRQGTPIPTHDIWIAALTLQHGLTLYARDKHFDHIPQLMRL
jgi:tRNA(fMet)-specific endonuclease VapC